MESKHGGQFCTLEGGAGIATHPYTQVIVWSFQPWINNISLITIVNGASSYDFAIISIRESSFPDCKPSALYSETDTLIVSSYVALTAKYDGVNNSWMIIRPVHFCELDVTMDRQCVYAVASPQTDVLRRSMATLQAQSTRGWFLDPTDQARQWQECFYQFKNISVGWELRVAVKYIGVLLIFCFSQLFGYVFFWADPSRLLLLLLFFFM